MKATNSQNRIDQTLAEALHGEMVPKFLATLDGNGKPNVVPIISLDSADERTLVFGELFIWKTKANLGVNPLVTALVVTEDLHAWSIQGRFKGFVDSGPYVKRMNEKAMFRYNAYVGIQRVAVIEVVKVSGMWNFSKLQIGKDLLPCKAMSYFLDWTQRIGLKKGRTLPARVKEKFSRTQAVKVMAYRGLLGYPEVIPTFSLCPTGSETMLFSANRFKKEFPGLLPGDRMAAALITMDPIAYQIKGIFTGQWMTPVGAMNTLQVDEVFSANPPLPGQPIELVNG